MKRSTFTAPEMSEWARDSSLSFYELCERADQFGIFILHYEERKKAKTVLEQYTEAVCQMKGLPRWMRRDILFNVSRHFMEPDFECFADDELFNGGFEDGEALYDQAVAYNAADAETRKGMRTTFCPEALALIDSYYARAEYYQQNQKYIQELKDLEETIECSKYGI